jgi:hypothetical protein
MRVHVLRTNKKCAQGQLFAESFTFWVDFRLKERADLAGALIEIEEAIDWRVSFTRGGGYSNHGPGFRSCGLYRPINPLDQIVSPYHPVIDPVDCSTRFIICHTDPPFPKS